MIKIKSDLTGSEHIVQPTIFPDGTSQVWKLPEWCIDHNVKVYWFFENERELIDLVSLNHLFYFPELIIPYLPYARQDKESDNQSTFNLYTFAQILNTLKQFKIVTFDAHSKYASNAIESLRDMDVVSFHINTILNANPTYLVFPDMGALARYSYLTYRPHVIFEKKRDESSGVITGHEMVNPPKIKSGDSFLIVDDICDGGATFISIANALREVQENIGIDLCVTHGLFSKGREVLHKAGIQNIYTTNTLLRNHGLENVFEVV